MGSPTISAISHSGGLRRHRILEYDLHLSAVGHHVGMGYILPIIEYLAPRWFIQTTTNVPVSFYSLTLRLIPMSLPFMNAEGYIVYGFNILSAKRPSITGKYCFKFLTSIKGRSLSLVLACLSSKRFSISFHLQRRPQRLPFAKANKRTHAYR